MLIEGKAHAYVYARPGTKKWDSCAVEAVLHAAGGILTDICGNRYKYDSSARHLNAGGILATSTRQAHSAFLSLIPEDLKRHLDS